MPQTPEITVSQATMIRAHVLKDKFRTKVMEAKEGESPAVVWSTHEATLALAIRQEVFQALEERGGVFVIEVFDGNVVMSLERGVVDLRRNLWNEMLATLGRGRSEMGVTRDAYDALFDITQLCHRGEVANALEVSVPDGLDQLEAFSELKAGISNRQDADPEDLTMLQGLCYVYFFRLTSAMRNELAGDGKVPWLIFQQED